MDWKQTEQIKYLAIQLLNYMRDENIIDPHTDIVINQSGVTVKRDEAFSPIINDG